MQTLNDRALARLETLTPSLDDLGIEKKQISSAGICWDFGVHAPGGLQAGLELARISLADLAQVSLMRSSLFSENDLWPHVTVMSDHPLKSCMFSQYAGWPIQTDHFFAMGSGPMRAALGTEDVFILYEYEEDPYELVGVLETRQLPDENLVSHICFAMKHPVDEVHLLVAPTASLAGSVQVVARTIETAMHKMLELKFDLNRIVAGWGTAPLPPIGKNDLESLGRTNDAILYGGTVHLWVTGDDDSLQEWGPKIPASSSESFGRPFLDLFAEADHDFYQMDHFLFSPARITLQNIETGRSFTFGELRHDVLKSSFGKEIL